MIWTYTDLCTTAFKTVNIWACKTNRHMNEFHTTGGSVEKWTGSTESTPPVFGEHCVSLQANRFRRWTPEQRTSRLVREMTLNASRGTDVMPVLSQMIRGRLAEDRALLCLRVKMPGFSYHILVESIGQCQLMISFFKLHMLGNE